VADLTDFRIGTLVRWNAGHTGEPDDIDELGIVTKLPGQNWRGSYHISWCISNVVSHHSADMIEESLFQGYMEVVG